MSRRRQKRTHGAGRHGGAQRRGAERTDGRAAKTRAGRPDWPVVALAAVGMALTLYLTGVAWFTETPAFCAPGSGCDVVQQSRWSTLLGLPIALWGFGVYALIALLALRSAPGLRRWRRLWTLSLIGLAISVYLTVIGIVMLDAVCAWCMASLATMTALFAVVAWRRPTSAPGMPWTHWGLNTGVVALFIVALLHLNYSGLLDRRESPRLQALATHLDESGVRYYGASWCAVCQEQNRLFGASADRLPYVECAPEGRAGIVAMACVERDIRSYPTWIINGERHEGLQHPRELADLTGFDWEGFSASAGD